MKKILITGFEAFDGHAYNPSELVANLLAGDQLGEYEIESQVWPVVFSKIDELCEKAVSGEYAGIFHLGLAQSRNKVTFEKVAINLMHCPGRLDNDGVEFINEKISKEGENAYFATVPIHKLVEKVKGASQSLSAGSYVCNYTMYKTLEKLSEKKLLCPSCFIHIPSDKNLSNESNWSVEEIAKVIKEVLAYQFQT